MDHQQLSQSLKQILGLRWSPVAVKMRAPGEEVPPGLMEPPQPLRHCQSIMAARRGNCLHMPPSKHACPDGAGILGLVEMSPKLQSGELYLLFKKLPDLECARKMIASRPQFPAGSYSSTMLAPLDQAAFEPDVVIFTIWPEQAMWLCCASTYATGDRQVFHTSGYNATCADLTVKVMQTGSMNISFGCYGSRASSEMDDFELYVSVPYVQLPQVVASLNKLSLKSMPESRNKIYMPPVMDNIAPAGTPAGDNAVELSIDAGRCDGCGLCEAFCPAAVIEMCETDGVRKARPVLAENCSACYTCVGQCPNRAIQLKH
jgi:uncharacterized protein (DUF169 family)/NAD-dependent dihydropyrimidine dehydrogenase PreA subunit